MKRRLIFILCIAGLLSLEAKEPLERMGFQIRFGIVKGGEAIYELYDTVYQGKPYVHSQLHGYTTGFANMLYQVDDRFSSIISTNDYLPLKSDKVLREQKYRFNNEVSFYHADSSAYSQHSGWHPVLPGIGDVSALMFTLRHAGSLDELKVNQVIEIPFWDTDEWYILQLRYTGTEIISTQLGEFECYRLEPLHVAGRYFNKKNPMNIWISKGDQKLPILMELNFSIGSVHCELVSYLPES